MASGHRPISARWKAALITRQGASMALEDAAILAESLLDASDPAGAFIRYEQLRRDRVQTNITTSARTSAPRSPADRRQPPPIR